MVVPDFLAPGTSFTEDNFPMEPGVGGNGLGMIQFSSIQSLSRV